MNFPTTFPSQHQDKHPGFENEMNPLPIFYDPKYIKDGDLLRDKVAVITGGDSGIGKAVAIAYAHQGANIVIVYYNENNDAEDTKKIIDALGRKCTLIQGDISNVTRAAMQHLKNGGCIINTASVVAYAGNEKLIDYSMTKGAIVALTRSLSTALAKGKTGIRVNAVAPGPIWTPLIVSSFDSNKVTNFGSDSPMGRAGQPVECAGAYVFLASDAASYISGQTIHVNGGNIVNS